MILSVHQRLRAAIAARLTEIYGLAPADQPLIAIDYAPNRALGDLAVPVAFELARRLRKAPRAIAQELAAALGTVEGFGRIEAAPNGYLNCFLDRAAFLTTRLQPHAPASRPADEGKTIVEHTAINPNKAAHIGHIRNSALGDTLVRVLRFRGVPVEVQNYIDDTGVQVADVVVGFQTLEQVSLDQVRALAAAPRFDYHCWDLYARVTEWYEADKTRLAVRQAALHDIEHGGNQTAEMGALVADAIVRRHLETMRRLHIEYDLLTWEGDILRLKFWAHAFEILKQQGTVYLQTEGRLAGCWVMAIDDGESGDVGDSPPSEGEPAETADEDEGREKVIVRSNGTVTYVGKDIAYQFWKFGLLGLDFKYRRFATRGDGQPLWATTSDGARDDAGSPGLWRRRHDLQRHRRAPVVPAEAAEAGAGRHGPHAAGGAVHPLLVRDGGALARHRAGARATHRRPTTSRSRSSRCRAARGWASRPTTSSTCSRRTATAEVAKRNPELSADEVDAHGPRDRGGRRAVLHGQVLARQGDRVRHRRGAQLRGRKRTVPAVRRRPRQQHLRQAEGAHGPGRSGRARRGRRRCRTDALTGSEGDELWGLVLDAARLDEVVEQVVRTLEFSVLAKHAFASRRRSTASITRRRSSTRSAPMCAPGVPPASPTSARS